jgi:hypothetical protein
MRVQDVSDDDEPTRTPAAKSSKAAAKAPKSAPAKAAKTPKAKAPAKAAPKAPKSAPAKAKTSNKGFTDHNASWLKPSKRAAAPPSKSEVEEEEEDGEEAGSGSDDDDESIEMEEGSIDGVDMNGPVADGDEEEESEQEGSDDEDSDGAMDDSFGAPADLLGSSSDEEGEQGEDGSEEEAEEEEGSDDDDDESEEEMEIEKKSRKLDARRCEPHCPFGRGLACGFGWLCMDHMRGNLLLGVMRDVKEVHTTCVDRQLPSAFLCVEKGDLGRERAKLSCALLVGVAPDTSSPQTLGLG